MSPFVRVDRHWIMWFDPEGDKLVRLGEFSSHLNAIAAFVRLEQPEFAWPLGNREVDVRAEREMRENLKTMEGYRAAFVAAKEKK